MISEQSPTIVTENPDCLLCCERTSKTSCYFAKCEHRGVCFKCGEFYMLEHIKNNLIPTCIQQECEAVMREDSISLYQYFSESSKKKWKEFSLSLNDSKRTEPDLHSKTYKYCKQVNCQGTILKDKCSKCLKPYCEKCGNFGHPASIKCRRNVEEIIHGAKTCPACSTAYVRDEKNPGCLKLKCEKCKYVFCHQCGSKWSLRHHNCQGRASVWAMIVGIFTCS